MPTEEKGTLPAAAVIQLTDYGVLPDSGADAMVPMQRAIEAASRIEGPVMLECQTGRYDFHPEHATRTPYYISNTASEEENPDVTKTIGILFKGMKDIVMEGNGSLFVFHGKQTMIVIDSCENVTISCVHTEYERPTVAEMTIEESGSDYFDVRIHPDFRYELEAGRLYFLGDGWRFREGPMQEYDPVIDKTWRIDNLMEKAVRVEELEPYRLRLHMEAAPNQVVGRVLQVRDGLRDQVGAFILKSRDITWENVGMHFMHGLGIVCQYSENLSFDRLNLAPRPETGRTVAAFADFIHLSGCRGSVSISSSRFIGGHDDPINVHGTHLQIIGTPAPDQLHLQFMHPQSYGFDAFFPDDEIEFVRSSSLAAYAGNVVKAVKAVNPREILLTLSEPAPEGIMPGDVVENITWTPEVEITNNYFARVPTRGVLVTTRRRVVIENNHFERMTMSGVLVADDAESWYESGRVKDIAIRGNRFIECGSSSNPVIYIAPENTEVHADKPVHANIRVEGNYFLTADAAVLGAKSTRQLSFTHNEVSLIGESSAIPDIIRLRACSEVTIADNSFSGGGADHKHIRIQDMKRDTLAVSPEQSLPVIG